MIRSYMLFLQYKLRLLFLSSYLREEQLLYWQTLPVGHYMLSEYVLFTDTASGSGTYTIYSEIYILIKIDHNIKMFRMFKHTAKVPSQVYFFNITSNDGINLWVLLWHSFQYRHNFFYWLAFNLLLNIDKFNFTWFRLIN